MAYTSHVPQDPAKLIPYLDAIESEADEVLDTLPEKWRQADCLYKNGVPEPFGQDPPLFAANLIRPSIRTGASLVTETKPALDVKPRRDGLYETAHLLRETIDAGWDELNVQLMLEKLQLFVDVLSSGFLFIGWDKYAHYGLGNVDLRVKDPRQMKVDAALRDWADLDQAQYIIDRDVVPLWEVARAFPDVADDLKPCGKLSPIEQQDKQQGGRGLGSRVKSGVYRLVTGSARSNLDTGMPRVELTRYWVQDPARDDDEKPLYPSGRLIIRANDDVICEPDPKKQQNPYYDGPWPWVGLDGIPDLDSPWGGSETEAIKRIQQTFNEVGNAASLAILREARSWVTFDEGGIQNESVNKFVQLGFRVVPKRRQYEFRHEPPGVTAATCAQWMQMCQGLIDYLTGVRDGGPTAGRGRVELRSPGLLEGLQQAQQVLIRSKARRLEAALQRLGPKWIARIFQFFDTDRLMHFVNADGRWDVYRFEHAKLQAELMDLALKRVNKALENKRKLVPDGEPTPIELASKKNLDSDEILEAIKGGWKDFPVYVQPYSSLSSTRQARAQERMTLAQNLWIPGYMVTEELGYKNAKELGQLAIAQGKERAEAGVPALMASGQQQKKRGGRGGGGK